MMYKNKKGFGAKHWVIAFIVFTSICALGFLMVFGISEEYDRGKVVDDKFNKTYNKFGGISDQVAEMHDATSSGEGLSFIQAADLFFRGTGTVIQVTFQSLLLPSEMAIQFATDTGAPDSVANILFTLPLVIITVAIVFIIIKTFSGGAT